MRATLVAVVIGGVAAGLTQSELALACGEASPLYYEVNAKAPIGVGAPLNAPIVVKLSGSPVDVSSPAVVNTPSLTLTKAGAAAALDVKPVGFPAAPIWVPVALLEPTTSYEAHFNSGYAGVPDTTWPFTTGTESAPVFSLTGQLEVSLEPGTDMLLECITNCGFPCTNKGEIKVTKARVKLPRASGGFAERSGTLWLTDDKPAEFFERSKTGPEPYRGNNVSLASYVNLEDPSVTELLVTVPSEALAYKPCFAFVASDARGDQASVEPLCLDATTVPIMNEGSAGSAGAPGNSAAGASTAGAAATNPNSGDPGFANDQKSSGTSSSCSFRRGPSSDSAWLVLLGLSPLLRRRGTRRDRLSVTRRR
jgi:hypothetical protein